MRNALPLLIAGTCLALLPLLGPAASSVHPGLERAHPCMAPAAQPITAARDWLGNLQGWQDSPLVLLWRSTMAAAKGRPGPAACNS